MYLIVDKCVLPDNDACGEKEIGLSGWEQKRGASGGPQEQTRKRCPVPPGIGSRPAVTLLLRKIDACYRTTDVSQGSSFYMSLYPLESCGLQTNSGAGFLETLSYALGLSELLPLPWQCSWVMLECARLKALSLQFTGQWLSLITADLSHSKQALQRRLLPDSLAPGLLPLTARNDEQRSDIHTSLRLHSHIHGSRTLFTASHGIMRFHATWRVEIFHVSESLTGAWSLPLSSFYKVRLLSILSHQILTE